MYWAEGGKQKTHNVSQRVTFSNSDESMIKIFINWLDIIGISRDELEYELYIHNNSDWKRAFSFWSSYLRIDRRNLKIRFKKHTIKSLRKNVGDSYKGLIKVTVKKSTDLNRKIYGWTIAIIENWGVV